MMQVMQFTRENHITIARAKLAYCRANRHNPATGNFWWTMLGWAANSRRAAMAAGRQLELFA